MHQHTFVNVPSYITACFSTHQWIQHISECSIIHHCIFQHTSVDIFSGPTHIWLPQQASRAASSLENSSSKITPCKNICCFFSSGVTVDLLKDMSKICCMRVLRCVCVCVCKFLCMYVFGVAICACIRVRLGDEFVSNCVRHRKKEEYCNNKKTSKLSDMLLLTTCLLLLFLGTFVLVRQVSDSCGHALLEVGCCCYTLADRLGELQRRER